MSEVTQDALLGGRVRIFQPKTGFRAGTDSILLAAALDASFDGQALDVGCGSGGALLPSLYRLPEAQFTGLELDPQSAELAERGLAENGHEARARIVHGDAGDLPKDWQNQFGLVFSNPPYFPPGAIPAPGTGKEGAYLESVPLKSWIQAMLYALRPKGVFVMVHRAAELARIVSVLERQAGEICVLPIHSYPGEDAKRVLVRARKGLRPGPLRLLEPRYLYQEKGGPRTEWAMRMQQDGAGLIW